MIMNERLLFGNPFLGFSLVSNKEPDVTGFVLSVFPIVIRCNTWNFGFAVRHQLTFWVFGFGFSLSINHPWQTRIPKNQDQVS